MRIGGEVQRRLTPAEQRGYDYCCQIRESINGMRLMGMEPKAIWVGMHGAAAMRALWYGACGDDWDGVLPKYLAGVPCREGSTGGKDYVIECYDDQELAERKRRESSFRAVDNPLQQTH